MSINAYNASTISALFAGLNNSFSGTSLSYGIDFTTYNSIKNGSYSKLMRLLNQQMVRLPIRIPVRYRVLIYRRIMRR
mgnify:CR=1 FL=1